MGSVAIFVILTLLHELDFRMRRSTKQVEVYVELKHNVAVGQFLDFVRDRQYEPSNLQILLENTSDNGSLAFSVTLKGQKNCNHDDIVTNGENHARHRLCGRTLTGPTRVLRGQRYSRTSGRGCQRIVARGRTRSVLKERGPGLWPRAPLFCLEHAI